MQVDVTFAEVPPQTLEVIMSRTSPGRYAIHEFAKNVFDVQIDAAGGGAARVERPNPSQWNVEDHGGTVRALDAPGVVTGTQDRMRRRHGGRLRCVHVHAHNENGAPRPWFHRRNRLKSL